MVVTAWNGREWVDGDVAAAAGAEVVAIVWSVVPTPIPGRTGCAPCLRVGPRRESVEWVALDHDVARARAAAAAVEAAEHYVGDWHVTVEPA